MKHSPFRSVSAVLVALFALLATHIGVAGPAQASTTVTLTAGNGVVGTPQEISARVTTEASVVPGNMRFLVNNRVLRTVRVTSIENPIVTSWTPTSAGSTSVVARYISDDGNFDVSSNSRQVSIAKASTATTLSAPGFSKLATPFTLSARVTNPNGYVPTGTVTFSYSSGRIIQVVSLDGNGNASVSVEAPEKVGNASFRVRYNGSNNAQASTSAVATTSFTPTGTNMQFTPPAEAYVGENVTLQTNVFPSNARGTVSFTLNGVVLGSTGVSSGKASFQWTPVTGGTFTLEALYTQTGSEVNGRASAPITVLAGQPAANISAQIQPGGTALNPQSPLPLRNGTSIEIAATANSGAPVSLSIAGACSLSGQVITATAGVGNCVLAAAAPAAGLYPALETSYPIVLALGTQTAPPPRTTPGRIRLGSQSRLSGPKVRSSAGQQLRWRVTNGRNICQIVTRSNGAVFLKATSTGTCQVRQIAPRVPGEWLRYRADFTYNVRP